MKNQYKGADTLETDFMLAAKLRDEMFALQKILEGK
jgi:hypothetical protein